GNLQIPGIPPQLELPTAEAPVGETSGKHEVRHGEIPAMNGHPAAAEGLPTSLNDVSRIRLRTLGSLLIEVDGRDQTQRVRDQPRLEFFLSYLLARKVCAPADAPDRSMIAGELAPPGIPLASQR